MFRQVWQSEYLSLLFCVAYFLVLSPFTPGLATLENGQNVLLGMLPLLVVATGQTIVLITAGIDLSATSIIAMTSVAGASIVTSEGGPLAGSLWGMPVAVGSMLIIGAGLGCVNGCCVALLRMPAFIVTLTSMMFLSGLSIWLTQSKSIYGLPSNLLIYGKNIWMAIGVAVVVAGSSQLLLFKTLFGKGIRAIGGNEQVALVSGVPVVRYTITAYAISGICAAVASILILGQLETGSPTQWENNLLDVIGATVIGGTSLSGGRGNVMWTVFGVLLLSLIDNSLNLLNLSYFSIMIVKGGVILLAALLDSLRRKDLAQ